MSEEIDALNNRINGQQDRIDRIDLRLTAIEIRPVPPSVCERVRGRLHVVGAKLKAAAVPIWATVMTLAVVGPLVFRGCDQDPVPPGPPPTPPPVPAPKGSLLIGVTDNAKERSVELAAILRDETLAKSLRDLAVDWRIVDVQGNAAEYQQHFAKVVADAKLTPPCMILYPAGGTVRVAPEPEGSEDVLAFLQGRPATAPPGHMPFVEVGGHKRYLACRPQKDAKRSAPKGGTFAQAVGLVPQSQWREIKRWASFPAGDWIYDQDGISSCVGNGAAGALRKARALAGMKDVRLAPASVYAQINGGRDQGAVISDSLTAMQEVGALPSAILGDDQKPFYLGQMPRGWKEQARSYRVSQAFRCDTFEEIMSAIQLGYCVVYGVRVGNNFNSFTGDGVAGISRGVGNHCMYGDGAKKLASGKWAVDNVNSWGDDWGPFRNGRCYLVAEHFRPEVQCDAYAVQAATFAPDDPIPFPK